MYTLSTLPLYGWILLVLVLASMAFGLVWFLWLGRRLRFPPGTVRTVTSGTAINGRRQLVHVIIDPVVEAALAGTPVERGLKALKLAVRSAAAVSAIRSVWTKARHLPADILDEVAVYYQSSAEFDKSFPNAAAYLSNTPASVGSGLPMAVVRDTCVLEVQATGEPVIHEMIHALLGEYSKAGADRGHTDNAWKAVTGDKSQQAMAEVEFKARLLGGRS
jgi:hypothetical protein